MDVKTKICGITNREDAFAAVEAGADLLGFMFYDASPRCISIEVAEAIAAELPPFVLRVGVFVDPAPDLVLSAMRYCGLNMLQFHGNEPPEFCLQFGSMTAKAFRIKDESSLAAIPAYKTDAYLLDSFVAGKQGGTGAQFNWNLAVEAKQFGKPIFLAGGLTPANVAEAVRAVKPFAVDVSSGVESAPGRKDHDKVREFIAAVRGA